WGASLHSLWSLVGGYRDSGLFAVCGEVLIPFSHAQLFPSSAWERPRSSFPDFAPRRLAHRPTVAYQHRKLRRTANSPHTIEIAGGACNSCPGTSVGKTNHLCGA